MICACVECYENALLETLDGPIAVYKSLVYRTLEAQCPDCGLPTCAKSLYHGSTCEQIQVG